MARRKKSSPLEDVLDLLAMLPWWVCLVLAAVSYFLLHRLAVPIQASDIQGQGGAMVGAMIQKAIIHGLANAGQYIVPLLCIAAAALSAWRRKQRQALVSDVAQARNATEWLWNWAHSHGSPSPPGAVKRRRHEDIEGGELSSQY